MYALKRIPTFKGIAHFTPIWKIEIKYMDGIIDYTYNVTTGLRRISYKYTLYK